MQARLRWKLNEAQAMAASESRMGEEGGFDSGWRINLDAPLPLSAPLGPDDGAPLGPDDGALPDKEPLSVGTTVPQWGGSSSAPMQGAPSSVPQDLSRAPTSVPQDLSRPQVIAFAAGDDRGEDQGDAAANAAAAYQNGSVLASAMLGSGESYGQEFMAALTAGVTAGPPPRQTQWDSHSLAERSEDSSSPMRAGKEI